MTARFETRDGRLVARVILLAHRFGCTYSALKVEREGAVYFAEIELEGSQLSLRRLNAQIGKLVDYEKEIA